MESLSNSEHALIAGKVGADSGPTELMWSIDSVPDDLAGNYRAVLVRWVLDYNVNFVTAAAHLIPPCWPLHPGLAREIAAIWAHWQKVFHGSLGPLEATAFYERTLPGFQGRITGWLGKEAMACRSGEHPNEWNDQQQAISNIASWSSNTLAAFEATWHTLQTHSSPPPADGGSVQDFSGTSRG